MSTIERHLEVRKIVNIFAVDYTVANWLDWESFSQDKGFYSPI